MKKIYISILSASILLAYTTWTQESKLENVLKTVWSLDDSYLNLRLKDSSIWVWFTNWPVYFNVSGNKDEIWAGVAYTMKNVTVGWAYSKNYDKGTQTSIGTGYVHNFENSTYASLAGKYTKYNAKNSYADSKTVKVKAWYGWMINDNVWIEVNAWYKSTKFKWYDNKKTSLTWGLSALYTTNDYSVTATVEADKNDVNWFISLSIPFGKSAKKSLNNMSQDIMNNFIADSSFDDSLVKNKKVEANTEVEPAPELPAQNVSISTSAWNIQSWEWTSNIVADNVWWSVVTNLTINSPYTLATTQFTFAAQIGWASETQTTNILYNGQVVWTKSVTVTWE